MKAEPIVIQASDRSELDNLLEAAQFSLKQLAMPTRTHGILVARLGPGLYSASLSDEVPFGITREIVH